MGVFFMSDKNEKAIVDQEHLKGGQESPDMQAFREQWAKCSQMHDLINGVGALCTQLFFLVNELNERNTLATQTNELLEDIRNNVEDIASALHTTRGRHGETVANNIDAIAEAFLDVVNGDRDLSINGVVQTSNDKLDNLERIADNLSTEDGFSVASALDKIGDNIDLVSNPTEDAMLRVHIDGDIMNHPY